MVPVDEVFDSKKNPEHPLSGHLPERDQRLSIRSRSASPAAYVFAPSWILSPTEKPGLRTTSLAFSSFGKRTHRDSDLKDICPTDSTKKSLLTQRTAVESDDSSLSPRPSASSPSPRSLGHTSRHATTSHEHRTDAKRPAKTLRNNSCIDLTKLPPSDTIEDFPTLATNAPDLAKHPTSSPWGNPHLIKEVFAQPTQEDSMTTQPCDPEFERLKALVPKRRSSSFAIKKHHLGSSPHSSRPRSTAGNPLPTRVSNISARQFPKRTIESPTPDEKRCIEENTDTCGSKDHSPEIEAPSITDEDKERFLNLVRVWTGGAVRWENNCGVLPRSTNHLNAKPLLPVGSDRSLDKKGYFSPFGMGPLEIQSQEPHSEDCSTFGMDNMLSNQLPLYSSSTGMNGVRDRWMFVKAPSSSLYYVM
ncbi:hypothetical protein CLU79DRAFT_764078 [Phycomyces nitens]|nr:hypothetical protein CLU79DRAFT_764078 [Phycomyces nitens]